MKPFSLRLAGLVTGLALVILFTATPTVKADEWNLETKIVANHDIEVPGAVLEANTPYWIKLMESKSDRSVVQVFNEDRDKLISMFIAISAERLQPAEQSTFTFMEVPSGHPVPVAKWFYPGHLIGLEFVYPKDQTDKFALWTTNQNQTGLVAQAAPMHTDIAADTLPIPAVEPAPVIEPAPANDLAAVTEQKSETNDIVRMKPTEPEQTEPVQMAQNTDNSNSSPRTELPHTAGELQLLGLAGAVSATLGAIRFRR